MLIREISACAHFEAQFLIHFPKDRHIIIFIIVCAFLTDEKTEVMKWN